MRSIRLRLASVQQVLDNGTALAEVLGFGESAIHGRDPARLDRDLLRQARKAIKAMPPGDVAGRRIAGTPQVESVDVRLDPPKESAAWQRPLTVPFPFVRWRHDDGLYVAYVPSLGIHVLVEEEEQIAEQVGRQIRLALSRERQGESLAELIRYLRRRELKLRKISLRVDVRSPKQRAQADQAARDREASVLKAVATDLTRAALPEIVERDREVRQLAEVLTGRVPQSVLLIGPSGVGKTAIYWETVRRRGELGLGEIEFWSTSGARLVAGMSGFGMWQERCQGLIQEVQRRRVVVHLDNLVELNEVGKHGASRQGIAAFLRPAIAAGQLLSVAECTREQLAVLEREDPQLAQAFFPLTIGEPNREQLRAILARGARGPRAKGRSRSRKRDAGCAGEESVRTRAACATEAMDTLDRLHRRYATYSVCPGRPLRFLRNLLDSKPSEEEVTADEVTRAFSRETGLPLFLLDDSLPLDLGRAHAWFAERVIGQPEPVRLVVDLLALVKAGLNRTGRPLASLLFIGPTGVGKTEMAKALAEFFYHDAGRMVRMDMSEYSDPWAVQRLIGGSFAQPGVLTRKVREQPFQVVLFDEFEKAHPLFFDLLLQVLGDGRLSDNSGRVADFTNAVVIMTSNLGAESFRQAPLGFGGPMDAAGAEGHFVKEVREFLRPELFNRIDRIVPFLPLAPATVRKIANREIDRVAARDGLRYRGVTLEVSDAALDRLARDGFDPRYGARPLRRAIERQLVAPLAHQLNRYVGETALHAEVDATDDRLTISVRATGPNAMQPAGRDAEDLRAVQECIALRRRVQALAGSSLTLRLKNERQRLEQIAERLGGREPRAKQAARRGKRSGRKRGRPALDEPRLFSLRTLLDRIDGLIRRTAALEDEMLQAFYGRRPTEANADGPGEDRVGQLTAEMQAAVAEIHRCENASADRVTVVVFGERPEWVMELARAYTTVAVRRGASVRHYLLKRYRTELDQARHPPRKREEKPGGPERPTLHLKNRKLSPKDEQKKEVDAYAVDDLAFDKPPQGVIGIALQVQGPLALIVLQPEQGVHDFHAKNRSELCLVETVDSPLADYHPPPGIVRRGAIGGQEIRRRYELENSEAVDRALGKTIRWAGEDLVTGIARIVDEHAEQRIWRVLEE